MILLMLLSDKKYKNFKCRLACNGKPIQYQVCREDEYLLILKNKALILDVMIGVHEERHRRGFCFLNACIQTKLHSIKESKEIFFMKTNGKLVEWLVELSP